MQVTFTRLSGRRYGVDVVREFDPPARMQAAPGFDEPLPHDLAHLLVEREFGLRLGIFGQLAAGGDAGTFWCAPADRTARLAQRAEETVRASGSVELQANKIGLAILEPLSELDEVAYIRFASVYRNFTSLDDFVIEVASMRASQSADPGSIPAAEALS